METTFIQGIVRAVRPHVLPIFALFVLNAVFFPGQWQKKYLKSNDVIHWEGGSQEITKTLYKTGKQLLWTNAMFGGMPTYQISYQAEGEYVRKFFKLFSLGLAGQVGTFFPLMLSMYVLLALLGIHPWLSALGAISFGLATNNLVLYEEGHINKIRTLQYLPLITAGLVLMLLKSRHLLGGTLFALALAGNLSANHIQMTYYFALCVGILGVIWLVQTARESNWKPLSKVVLLSVFGMVLALGSVTSSLWPTYEYARQTMRGKPILEISKTKKAKDTATKVSTSSGNDGLSWDYATLWSNDLKDLLAMLIPAAVGGSSTEKVKSGAAFIGLQATSPKNPDGSIQLPMYWGNLPVTSGPVYVGAISFFLFLLGMYLLRGPLKWWMGLSVLFILLLSMGKHIEPLQRFMYEFMPLYNKFRAPSSSITIIGFFIAVPGMLVLAELIKKTYSTQEVQKGIWITGGLTAGIALVFALFGGAIFDFTSSRDNNLDAGLLSALRGDRQAMLVKDAWRSFLLIAGAAGLLVAFVRQAIKPNLLILALSILVVIDFWGVGRRYSYPQTQITKTERKALFKQKEADRYIKTYESNRGYYRVYDRTAQPFNSTFTSYHHNSVGGYSAAKLQRYQDLIDFHLTAGNEQVFNMLNTKYMILPDGNVQYLQTACGPAWFVEDIRIVQTPNQEMDALSSFDARSEAIVLDNEFHQYIGDFNPQKEGNITLRKYNPEHLVYESFSPSAQFAVFSEIWYGPDLGWVAYLDGKEVPHIRANYALRAMRVPAGTHRIEFVFKPRSVTLGNTISAISSSLLLLGFFSVAGVQLWKWGNTPVSPGDTPHDPVPPRTIPTPSNTEKKKKWTKGK